MSRHLCNRFQTALLLLLTHLDFIITESVRKLFVIALHVRRPYVGCVLTQRRRRQNRPNWLRVHTTLECRSFFRMAGCVCTVGEINTMLNAVFLNELVSGVGILSCSGQPLPRLSFTTSRH